ncbi:MAG TPA: trypsin-like peptidase domain-containing protein [Candidatus Udaeobacter sp.]|jgi:S1-C subfamily serine protease|nr:trypsin-like peptidase domain-containing protein [Candidatus Udaeobacter sp.]
MTPANTTPRARIILAALVLLLGAYWLGARYGQRQPVNVEAVPPGSPSATNIAQRDAALTDDESINVRIYRQASSAVANILTKATEYDFFMDPVPVEGAGSGFVIDGRGYILTNFHVVQEAQSIEVVLGDQSKYPAKFIGADQRNDVALIQIDPKGKKLAVLSLGDSSALQVGQKVLAIGNPFGFQSTLTTGIVSALGRTVQTGQTTFIDEAIQTDAAINRGNSGGPLINSHGEVIGINSAIYTPSGTTAGIGFAIPINTAKVIANDLITDGRVHRAFLGVETLSVGGWLSEALDLPVKEGLLVEVATRGGPAAAAGIHGGDRVAQAGMRKIYIGGDVITAIDGQKVAGQLDVNVILNRKRPGDSVNVTVYRGGKKMDVPVKLGERSGNS